MLSWLCRVCGGGRARKRRTYHVPCMQVRLRQKLSDIPGAVTSFFTGKAAEKDPAIVKLEELKVRGV